MAGPYKGEASNMTVTYAGTDITQYCNQAAVEATVAEIDTTNLASLSAESSPASTSWTVPVGGMLDKALDDVLGLDAITPPAAYRNLVITVGPSGTQTTYTWTASGTSVGATIDTFTIAPTEPTQLITWSGSLLISGGPVRS